MYQIRRQLFLAVCFLVALGLSNGQYNCNSTSQEYVTIKGSVPPGTPCCFPFVYRGVTYESCTTKDHQKGTLWCAVEHVYKENNKLWGNCRRIAMPAPTPAPTTAVSTAVTTDTPIDASDLPSQIDYCNETTNSIRSQEYVTQGGTAPPGTPCCFPFFYREELYYECTTRDRNQPWCAVESVYNDNYTLWGNCKQTGIAPNTAATMKTEIQSMNYLPVLAVLLMVPIVIVIIFIVLKQRKKHFSVDQGTIERIDLKKTSEQESTRGQEKECKNQYKSFLQKYQAAPSNYNVSTAESSKPSDNPAMYAAVDKAKTTHKPNGLYQQESQTSTDETSDPPPVPEAYVSVDIAKLKTASV